MATKKPQRRVAAPKKASPTLMGNQDTATRGDTGSTRKSAQMTFWVTPEHRDAIRAYAAANEITVSQLILEGLDMRMKKGKRPEPGQGFLD